MSIREVEHWLDAELFLNKYPRWDIEGPYHPIILHSMFLHPAGEGWREAERVIHWGHQHGLPKLDLKANLPAIQLVGYQTSEGNLGPLSWGISTKKVAQPATLWALTEGRSHLRHIVLTEELLAEMGGTTMLEKDQCSATVAAPSPSATLNPNPGPMREKTHTMRPSRGQRGSPAGVGNCPQAGVKYQKAKLGSGEHPTLMPLQPSSSCLQSRSLDRHERSLSRHRPERCGTFCNPEVELILSERSYWEPQGHPTREWMEGVRGTLCPSKGQKYYVPERCPWPTQELEIGWVNHQNHQLRITRCGWIGEPASWTPCTGGKN